MTASGITELVSSLYETWYGSVVRYAARRMGSIQAAEDIVQEAFMQLYREMMGGRTVENPRAWTFCVVRRQVMHQAGVLRREVDQHEPAEILDRVPAGWVSPVELENDPDRLRKLLSILTKREEEVITLRLAAMKYREIAEALQITESSVNTLLIRALKKLKQASISGPRENPASHATREIAPKTLQ
jgi:RNA polymerase sigma factor (sigma-70 family)